MEHELCLCASLPAVLPTYLALIDDSEVSMKLSSFAVFLLPVFSPVQASIRGVRGRKLQLQLVGYGGKPDASRFPLQLCEGKNGRTNFLLLCDVKSFSHIKHFTSSLFFRSL